MVASNGLKSEYFIGNSAEILGCLDSNSAQLVVTSPPYWSIKDYDHPMQIGFEDSYEAYLLRLGDVWDECIRVLEPGCRLAINIGDQFLRASDDRPYRIVPIHADIIRQITDSHRSVIYLGGIIWRKISTTNPSGGGTWMGSTYYPRDGYVTYEHEFILLFKKLGKARRPNKESKAASRLTKEQRSEWFRGYWDFPPARQDRHKAAFPLELPMRLIRMFTFANELVVDPFVGSGTTLEAAYQWSRNSIGIDLKEEYAALASGRVPILEIRRDEDDE